MSTKKSTTQDVEQVDSNEYKIDFPLETPYTFMSPQEKKESWWKAGVALFIELSGWIAGPLIGALFLGRWLDRRYGTEPWWLLGCLAASFLFSNMMIVKKGKAAMKNEHET